MLASSAAHAQTSAPTPDQVREQRAPREAAPLVHPITSLHKPAPKPTEAAKTPAKPATATKEAAKPVAKVTATSEVAKPVQKLPVKPVPAGTAAAKPATPGPAAAPAGPIFGPLNRTVIVLDPSHGGQDSGSRLSDNLLEKDITLAFAFKLRSLLQARGFTVVTTRDSDSLTTDGNPNPLSLDDRAGIANHSRAIACLLLHASAAGKGVHLYSSELTPTAGEATNLPWLTAQSAWVNQSRILMGKLTQSITRSGLPVVTAAASIRPVDSLTCPAIVVELAPKSAGDPGSIDDSGYQQTAAEAIAGALIFWRNQMQPPPKLIPIPVSTTSASTTTGVTQ